MHKADIFSYERVENVGQTVHGYSSRTSRFRLGSISIRSISMSILAFMIGRVSLLGGVSPFGMAFFAATYGGVSPVAIGTSIVLGILSWSFDPALALKFIAEITLFGVLTIFARWAKVRGEFVNCLKIFVSVFLVCIFPLFFRFLLYDFILSIFEALITVAFYILLKKGTRILLEDEKRSVLNTEEVISLGFIGALAIAGIRDFGIFGAEFRSIACIFIVLILARAKGAGIGAAAGVVLGIVSGFTGTANFNVIGSYAFSGLLAGLFKKLGNIGVILGFITGNAVLTYFITGSTEVLIQLRDIVIAAAAFYMLPKKVVSKAGKIFDDRPLGMEDSDSESLRPANTAVQKLNAFSRAVEELAATFNRVPQPEQVPGDADVTSFFDTVAERVCKDCSLCLYCWDRKFSSTYQSMFSLLEKLEAKGAVRPDDIPDCFADDSCGRPKELAATMNSLYELYRVNVMWKKKVSESRGLVSQQLEGVSRMIAKLAREIDSEASSMEELEASITRELTGKGYDVDEVTVERGLEEGIEAAVEIRGCSDGKRCIEEVKEIVSGAVGKRMEPKGCLCEPDRPNSKFMLRLTSTETYGVTVGVARASKSLDGVSGDSYTFIELKDKKYILGLSDGMGTGETAARNSKVAMDLLERFLESGFDKDIAVKIINSVLVLKTADESYATIDISAVDLYTGQVEFVKIGSPPAYIKTRDGVEIIKGASLPAGVLENLDMDLCGRKVEAGDFIVMVSDGVTDSNWKDADCGDWIADFLNEVDTRNPQELADMIKEKALANYKDGVGDDVTVLVAKVWQRV